MRLTADKAGYMELTGAVKTGDCSKVQVSGGISDDRGCCNEFEPKSDSVTSFKCGNCEYSRAMAAPKPPKAL